MKHRAELVPIVHEPLGLEHEDTAVRRPAAAKAPGIATAQLLPLAESPRNDTDAWELIRDDLFDRISTDEELDAAVLGLSTHSRTPYSDLIRRMIGTDLVEDDAKTFFRRVLEHRRSLASVLGRNVDIRVAALDLMTTSSGERPRRDSHPILVAPALLEKALEQATQDPITRLPQRQHFMNLLRHELGQRNPRPVVVVFVDLDGFKEVNDRHGHACGDEVLRRLARVGENTIRHADVLARIGGDEFALMLVDAPLAVAESVVDRLRHRFEARTAAYGTSFSAGIAIADPGDTAEDLLAKADAAMYREKRARQHR